jgi:hypothetical protein
MEQSLFSWENWDQLDTMLFCFSQCTLKVDIGKYKAGDIIEEIALDYSDGVMEFYKDNDAIDKFSLSLKVI